MPDITVNDKVVSRLKTGFVLTPDDKKKKAEDLFFEQPLFKNLAAYVFNAVSDTSNMQKVRRVTRDLITLDDSDYKGTDYYFDEEEYDKYLQDFMNKLEKVPIVPNLLQPLEASGYVQPAGKNRAFSAGLRSTMEDNKTRLIDLGNDLKVSQLLGTRYGKGLDDTDRKTKPAQERAKDKYISRSSRMLGAFDRSEPVLYPSTLEEYLTTTGTEITIDTEGYFKKIFKVEGYGVLGTDSFQFNSVSGKITETKEKDDDEESEKEKDARLDREAEEEALEEFGGDMETEEGITQKMLRKAETKGSNKLVTLKILGNGKYQLNKFGRKEAFSTDNRDENLEELWESLQDMSLPNKKELIEIVRSQRKSGLKDAILGALTPQSNKIKLGQVKIVLKKKEWEDEEAFILWATKGGGQDEDKKLNTSVKNMTKRTLMLKSLFDDLESNWGSYVYDKKEAPFDKFILLLSEKKRKELVNTFNNLIINIQQDKYNLDNPKQVSDWRFKDPRPVPKTITELFSQRPLELGEGIIEGKTKDIGIEEIVYDKDGKPKKDKDGKPVTEVKEYYPAFGNHDTFVTKIKDILKNVKSGDYRESVNIIPLLAEADDVDTLMSTIKEQLEESQDWKREGDVEFKVSDTEGIPILTFSRTIKTTMEVDTNIGRRTGATRGKDRFARGRFAETGVGASKEQEKARRSDTDAKDADELRLVYNEYMGLKEMIER